MKLLQDIFALSKEVLVITFLHNALWRYVLVVILFFLVKVTFTIFNTLLIKRLKKLIRTKDRHIGSILIEYLQTIPRYFFLLMSVLLPLLSLQFSDTLTHMLYAAIIILVGIELIKLAQKVSYYFVIEVYLPEESGNSKTVSQTRKNVLGMIIKILIWITGILIILMNIGVQITPLIASLGIGGIAVGFALQNILSDIFSSFSIFFDKPFVIGDFVVIGDHGGTVTDITLKSTRLQTPDGQKLSIPNNDVTSSKISNFAGLTKRRAVVKIGVTYETDIKLLKKIPDLIRDCIQKEGNTDVIYVVFKDYGDFSLNFESKYHVHSKDDDNLVTYNEFMETKNNILYRIFECFAQESIEFAYPTQVIYKKGD